MTLDVDRPEAVSAGAGQIGVPFRAALGLVMMHGG
jgi:hypothetical protein